MATRETDRQWACPKKGCGYVTTQPADGKDITHLCPVDHRDRKLKLLPSPDPSTT